MGILGVIVQVSLKVLQRPLSHLTLGFEMSETEAVDKINEWAGRPLPLSASVWHEGVLHLRLAGASAAVRSARHLLGGENVDNSQADVLRSEEHTSELQSLMRISYAVFCLKKKKNNTECTNINNHHIKHCRITTRPIQQK